jgi:hypothetical protein
MIIVKKLARKPTIFFFFENCGYNKITCKIKKTWHRNPLFSHIGDEISKNTKKKTLGFKGGMKFNLVTNLVLNLVCLVLSFLEHF